MSSFETVLLSKDEDVANVASVGSSGVDYTPVVASAPIAMPWEDYDDDGGFDDDASLNGKIPTFSDRIRTAGFRELLGFGERQ